MWNSGTKPFLVAVVFSFIFCSPFLTRIVAFPVSMRAHLLLSSLWFLLFLAIELQLAGYEMNRASWRRGSTSLLLRGGSKRRRCLPVEHRGHHLDCTKFIYVSSLLVWAPMPIVYHWSNKHCPCWKHGTKQNVCMPTYSEQESSVLLSREK